MFEIKVFLTNEGIFIGKKKIPWNSIAGIRITKDNIFCLLIYKDKSTIEIFMTNGNVLYLSKSRNIFFDSFNSKNKKNISIEEATFIIKNNSININPELNNWSEWRIVIPTIVFQIIGIFASFFNNNHIDKFDFFENLVKTGLLYGLFGMIIGFIWERVARKKQINKVKNHNLYLS